eukprot:CAMPEP_0195527578 /NCGR_PEP_ID=MMETSP0794_2-20130614/29349_1 /TAXON_ID=515487 /ORGANISM="Stephanopyxis turris, Strain CCMP 815" /LENGTH=125 /DNA_ID=CAMNT_0040658521 /DNA_START=42 /DNA_END=416 /DNA_ORIENTATION=-
MFRLAIRSSATFARRRAVTGGTSSRSLSTAAAEWKDADESTAGGVLTNLQHHYKQKRAPLRGLKDVLQKCEQATELPIAVAALSLYHQKKGPMQTERISQFIATCCRLGHPGLALAAISGDKKRT